jgi:hypothetical protein
MAEYSREEFAKLCGQTKSYQAVYIKRGKIKVQEKVTATGTVEVIDSNDAANTLYLEKIYGRMDLVPGAALKPANSIVIPLVAPVGAGGNSGAGGADGLSDEEIKKALEHCGGMNYQELEKVYKYLQGEKLKSDIEKNKIDIQKKKGEVIPAELISPLFVQHSQSFLQAFKNVAENILTEYALIKKFTVPEIADMRGRMIIAINKGMTDADALTASSVSGIVKEFAQKRGVGERN